MRMRRLRATAVLLSAGMVWGAASAPAAVWSWSAEVPGVVSSETDGPPRAFLWIPPDCARVRAVIVGQHNMLEEGLLEHPLLRAALAEAGMAAVWVTPAFNMFFRFDQGAGEQFEAMMRALADVSGYDELAAVPAVPIGHSAMASYPYHFGAWRPGRTLAAVSVKGTWPDFRDANSPPWQDHDLDGVPLLFINGEYEDAQVRAGKAADFRARHPACPLTMFVDAGGGHFDYHDRIAAFLALYLRKVAAARLGPDGALRPVTPATQGWLYDRWRLDEPPRAEPAPVGRYTGDVQQAFWCFDADLARAAEQHAASARGKQAQLLGYAQDGAVLPQNPKLHAQVEIPFRPVGDGLTFHLAGVFLDTVPEGRPERWSGLPKGAPIGHAAGGGPVVVERICGPVRRLGPDTFALRFDRLGFDNRKRSNEIWLMATHPGDAQYKRAVQQAVLHVPRRNEQGAEQVITFALPAAVPAGTSALPLRATSSAGAPVGFYVREGPAEVVDDQLVFTPIPPRAKYPVAVTVVAWQWGRSIEPRLRSATPIERTVWITRSAPGGQP